MYTCLYLFSFNVKFIVDTFESRVVAIIFIYFFFYCKNIKIFSLINNSLINRSKYFVFKIQTLNLIVLKNVTNVAINEVWPLVCVLCNFSN